MSVAVFRSFTPFRLLFSFVVALLGFGCTQVQPPAEKTAANLQAVPSAALPTPEEHVYPVMLGIDVLETDAFAAIRGKRVGLLTHAAGVNRHGVSTIEILRHAPNVKLVALYGVEHGLYGKTPAGINYPDGVDPVTRLPLFSLYNGKSHKPTPQQLKTIDVLVIDLQDIGSRSYTFIGAMKAALEACFEHNKEVIVLDRPNPLGGLKVDGPPIDTEWISYVGAFHVPYVHGLTMGELAIMAKNLPGVLAVPDGVRNQGRLTVVRMKGWRRSMRWPETGLTFVPTSPRVQDFAAVAGYPMTGLGCEIGGFTHGIGTAYPFRSLGFPKKKPEELARELQALHLPGLAFSVVGTVGANGKPVRGVYIEIADWNAWRPTELSFYLMRLAAAWNRRNPFTSAPAVKISLFKKLVGSTAWWNALAHDGARVDVASFTADWRQRAENFQQIARRFWLYPP